MSGSNLLTTLGMAASFVLLSPQLFQDDHKNPVLSEYASEPGSARTLVKDGTWLLDGEERYVLLRGVNLGSRSKLPPYIPIMPLSTETLDLDQCEHQLQIVSPDLARLRLLGVNVVRLPIIWKALEPTPNPNLEQLQPEGSQYVKCVEKIIDELYSRQKLYVILDFHQDIANEIFGGDGFPDWAVGVDPKHKWPSPGSDLADKTWSLNYLAIPWHQRLLCHLRGGS